MLLNSQELATLLGISKKALFEKLKRHTFPQPDKRTTGQHGRPGFIWSLQLVKHHIPLNDTAIEEKITAMRTTVKQRPRTNKIDTVKQLRKASKELEKSGQPKLSSAVKVATKLINQMPNQDFQKATLNFST